MTTSRSEDLLVGFIALALLPFIAHRVLRGWREGRLPLYRAYFARDENASKFNLLLGLHMLSFVIVALIGVDLLLGLTS